MVLRALATTSVSSAAISEPMAVRAMTQPVRGACIVDSLCGLRMHKD